MSGVRRESVLVSFRLDPEIVDTDQFPTRNGVLVLDDRLSAAFSVILQNGAMFASDTMSHTISYGARLLKAWNLNFLMFLSGPSSPLLITIIRSRGQRRSRNLARTGFTSSLTVTVKSPELNIYNQRKLFLV
jgi:hypothetical protein